MGETTQSTGARRVEEGADVRERERERELFLISFDEGTCFFLFFQQKKKKKRWNTQQVTFRWKRAAATLWLWRPGTRTEARRHRTVSSRMVSSKTGARDITTFSCAASFSRSTPNTNPSNPLGKVRTEWFAQRATP